MQVGLTVGHKHVKTVVAHRRSDISTNQTPNSDAGEQDALRASELRNEDKFRELQARGCVRYEDLPLKTSDGRRIEIEFGSNVYPVHKDRERRPTT